jgi:hypothetical protein
VLFRTRVDWREIRVPEVRREFRRKIECIFAVATLALEKVDFSWLCLAEEWSAYMIGNQIDVRYNDLSAVAIQ